MGFQFLLKLVTLSDLERTYSQYSQYSFGMNAFNRGTYLSKRRYCSV